MKAKEHLFYVTEGKSYLDVSVRDNLKKAGYIVTEISSENYESYLGTTMDDVVVIDTNEYNFAKRESFIKKPERPITQKDDTADTPHPSSTAVLSGEAYLASKTVPHEEDTENVDEQLEAKVTRLELQVQKLELRLLALENKAYRRNKHYQTITPTH